VVPGLLGAVVPAKNGPGEALKAYGPLRKAMTDFRSVSPSSEAVAGTVSPKVVANFSPPSVLGDVNQSGFVTGFARHNGLVSDSPRVTVSLSLSGLSHT